jgi:hypothetical protein
VIWHPDYPATWAALPSEMTLCPDLSGTYEDGSADTPREALSGLLLRKRLWTSSVKIDHSTEGTLVVEFRNHGNTIEQLSFSQTGGDFSCDSGWMQFKTSFDAGSAEGMGFGAGGGSFSFAKSADGFLVAKVSWTAVGLALGVVPIGGSMTEWYRFRPLPSE